MLMETQRMVTAGYSLINELYIYIYIYTELYLFRSVCHATINKRFKIFLIIQYC